MKWITIKLLIIISLCCSNKPFTQIIKAENSSTLKKSIKSNYNIIYYSNYSYSNKKYYFKKSEKLSIDQLKNKGYYYKVFCNKLNNKIYKINTYENHKLHKSTIYQYDKKNNLKNSKVYLEINKFLDLEEIYKNEILIKRKKFSKSENLLYTSKIEHIDNKGIKEYFYNLKGKLKYIVFYNNFKKVVRLINYKNQKFIEKINFQYNKKKLLKRKVYYNSKNKIKEYIIYQYDDYEYQSSIQSYINKQLVMNTRFDKKGREIQIDKYKNKRLIKYAKIKYNKSGKNILWFSNLDLLLNRKNFNYKNQIIKDVYYNTNNNEKKTIYYEYNKDIKLKTKIFYNENLILKNFFNSDNQIIKTEHYNKNKTIDLINEKRYNNKLLYWESMKNKSNKIITQKRYYYNKIGKLFIEDIYDKSTLLYKKVYEYSKKNFTLISIKFFKMKKLLKKEFYNNLGQVIKREYGNYGNKIKTELYKYQKDKLSGIRIMDRYNNVDKTIRIRYSKDKVTSLKVRQEDAYDRNGQYLGSILSWYDFKNRFFKREIFNYLQQKIETIKFNTKNGKKISHIKHEVQ